MNTAAPESSPPTPARVLAALGDPAVYPHPVEGPDHLETHISHVFLTGELAYKVKKPVNLGFLDFTSLEKRRRYCKRELSLNRRLAPRVYRQVMALIEGPLGPRLVPLEEAEGAEVLEYAVQMAQMDQARMMDRLLDEGGVEPGQVEELAAILSDFYQKTARGWEVDFFARPEQVRLNLEENFRQTRALTGEVLSRERWRGLKDHGLGFMTERRELFLKRVAEGRAVDGHGDLHSGNINLPRNEPPIIFDCIEFNRRFRFQDQACDLAFLAMDLDFHGKSGLSRLLTKRFWEENGDDDLPEILDFYKCYRAVVRAKIHGFLLSDPRLPSEQRKSELAAARAYLRLAEAYTDRPPLFLVAFMGLMGTGKSHLAGHLARAFGWPLMATDRLRKLRAGRAPEEAHYEAWGQGLYGEAATRDTYQALAAWAGERLARGQSVILDASFRERRWRELILETAEEQGAWPLLVEVVTSPEVVRERLIRRERRGGSVSDGRWELYARQAESWEDTAPLRKKGCLLRVDGAPPAEENLAIINQRLKALGPGGLKTGLA